MNVKLLLKVVKASFYSIIFIALTMLPSILLDRLIPMELYRLILDHIGYESFLALVIVTAALIWFSIMLEEHILGVIPLILSYSVFAYLLLSSTHYGLYIIHYENLSIEIDFKLILLAVIASMMLTLSIKILGRLSKLKY